MHPKAKEAADKLADLRKQQAIIEPPPRTEAPAPVRQSEAAPASATAALAPIDPPRTEVAPAQIDPEKHPDYWKTRFLSTEGVIRQERERHEAALAAERQRVATLEQQTANDQATLKAQLDEALEKLKTPPTPPALTDFFTEEMVLENGEENMRKQIDGTTKLVQRLVAEGVTAATAPLKQELISLKADRANSLKTDAQRQHASFINAVSTAIPGWEKWATVENSGPEFASYMTARAPGSRKTRQEALNEAWNARDSVVVVELLQGFLDSIGEPAPIPSSSARQIPAGRAAGEDPQPPAGPIMFLDEVEKFRSDYSHGAYKKRAKEAAEMLNKINRAAGTPGGIQRR